MTSWSLVSLFICITLLNLYRKAKKVYEAQADLVNLNCTKMCKTFTSDEVKTFTQ